MKPLKNIRTIKKLFFPVFIIGLLLNFLFSSCYKERFTNEVYLDEDWSPDVAVPVIHSKLIMKDVLNDWDHNNLFVEDETHFLYLVYWDEVFSQTAEELITIPDQNINTAVPVIVVGALPYGYDLAAPPYTAPCSFSMPINEELDKAILKSGTLDITLSSADLNHNATINISIPSATLNGIAFDEDIYFSYGQTTNASFDLTGYQLLFDNVSPNVNNMDITYTVTLHGTGNDNNSPYTLNIDESFNSIKYKELYGDFKQQTFTLKNDSVLLRIFDNNIYGLIDFENPSLSVWAYNSYGIPISIGLNDFRGLSFVNPPFQVDLYGYPNPWIINAPGISEIGLFDTTTFSLNVSNSNIKDAVNISPKFFIADLTGTANPSGSPADNFITDTSRFVIDIEVELPLWGKAWDFVLADTLDFALGDMFDLEQIEFIILKINMENAFPVDAIGQVYFVDSNNAVLDSLMTPPQQFITAAPVGSAPQYRTTGTTIKNTEVKIEQPRLAGLKNSTRVVVLSRLATSDNGTKLCKIYSDYFIDIQIGVRAKATFELK